MTLAVFANCPSHPQGGFAAAGWLMYGMKSMELTWLIARGRSIADTISFCVSMISQKRRQGTDLAQKQSFRHEKQISDKKSRFYSGSVTSVVYPPSSLARVRYPPFLATRESTRTSPKPCSLPLEERKRLPTLRCFFPAELVNDI